MLHRERIELEAMRFHLVIYVESEILQMNLGEVIIEAIILRHRYLLHLFEVCTLQTVMSCAFPLFLNSLDSVKVLLPLTPSRPTAAAGRFLQCN